MNTKTKIKINKYVDTFDTSYFWNARETLTHSEILFYLIIGNRGGGKSFGAKEWAIDNFISKKEQFGYIRRYKEDLKQPMIQFFKDIEYKYPDYEFKVDGTYFYCRLKVETDEKIPWTENDICGYGFTLSTADNRKSIAYPNITTLIFDEFLLDKGSQHYLPSEPIKLLNLYETIARPGTPGRKKVKLLMLANALSVTNPYFLFWDLKLPTKQDKNGKWIWKHPKRPILVEDVRNENFIDKKKNTAFGKIIEGTRYADYSIDNKFLLDDDTFIEKKGSKAKYYFTFIYKGIELGVWVDMYEGKLWVSKQVDNNYLVKYAVTMKDHKPNTMLIKQNRNRGHYKVFIENYKLGNVYFEDMNIKNLCYEIMQMTLSV